MPDARTRFAPAPTGRLHLGHVVNAFYVWQTARAHQARVLLRIEDHDRQRSRPEFERAILDDLEWLGFVPDEPPFDAFRAGRCEGRQSDRHEIYEDALAMLRSQGLTYACECSRAEIASMAGGAGGDELRYRGTCSRKQLQEQAGRGIRVRLEPSIERFNDLRHGWQGQCPAQQCGDLLVRDRDGNWTYQFAAAVDDLVQGITLVVRGDDLLPSTGRQIQLARLLGRQTAAEFLHHPLIMKSPTQKLSKSDGATGVSELRARGWSPADVVRTAIELVGSSH